MFYTFKELDVSVQEKAIDEYIDFVGLNVPEDVTRAEVQEALLNSNDRLSDWLFREDGTLETDDSLY